MLIKVLKVGFFAVLAGALLLIEIPKNAMIALIVLMVIYGASGIATKEYHRIPLYGAASASIGSIMMGFESPLMVAVMLYALMIDAFMS